MRRSPSGSSSGGGTVPPTLATWDPTLARYFFVDYDAGSDSSLGYIDAAPGTTFSGAAAAAVAIKTFTRLLQIVPLLGNDRIMVVLIKPRAAGATYLDADGVTQSVVDWSGLSGYKLILRRGSTDLTNSTADRLTCGFITTLAGPNGDGSFTVLAGATTTVWSVTGTPFGAEPANIGNRVRFTGNVTGALANINTSVQINSTSQITASIATATPPVAGDTFFLEKPGVAVAQWIDTSPGQSRTIPISVTFSRAAVRDVGIMVKGTTEASLSFSGLTREIAGCEQDSTAAANVFRLADCEFAAISAGYSDETNTTRAVGTGLRMSATGWSINRVRELDADVFVHATLGGAAIFDRVEYGNAFTAAYLGSSTTLRASGLPSPGSGNGLIVGAGASGGANKTRSIGGLVLSSFNGVLRGIDFAVAASSAFFSPNFGQNGATVVVDNLTGTAGASSYAFDCAGSGWRGCTLICGTVVANTVTGGLGDIRYPSNGGTVVGTHTGLTRTNIFDRNGNQWIGTAGRIVGAMTQVNNGSGGALAIGDVVRRAAGSGVVTKAQADTLANSTALLVMATAPANGADGFAVPPGSGTPSMNFAAAPATGDVLVYLSAATAGTGTTTKPVISGTQQLVKLGKIVRNISGTTAETILEPDLIPENPGAAGTIWAEVSDVASTFSATQTGIAYTGAITANRASTLESLATLSVGTVRELADLTSSGVFNISLTPNGTDLIDGVNAAIAIVSGSKMALRVVKLPTGGWKRV